MEGKELRSLSKLEMLEILRDQELEIQRLNAEKAADNKHNEIIAQGKQVLIEIQRLFDWHLWKLEKARAELQTMINMTDIAELLNDGDTEKAAS